MSEAEVLAYLLQYKKATPPEVAHHFEEDLLSVAPSLAKAGKEGARSQKETELQRGIHSHREGPES